MSTIIMESFLLALALSFDTFLTGFAYGSNKIKIPIVSVLVINIICSVTLAFSLFFGSIITSYLSLFFTKIVSFLILLCIGLIKLFDSIIKAHIKKSKDAMKEIQLKFSQLKLILHVYADPKVADINRSRNLSTKEAISLAIAISLDGLIIGLSYALIKSNIAMTISFSFVLGFTGIIVGSYLGKIISNKTDRDYSFISGILLLLLAFSKLK